MAKKRAFPLRLDEEALASLEKWAADEFRSTNGQIEWIVKEALKKAGRLKSAKNNAGDTNSGADTAT